MLDEQDRPAIAEAPPAPPDAAREAVEAPALPVAASPALEEAVNLARAASSEAGPSRVAMAAAAPVSAATSAATPAGEADAERRRPVRIVRERPGELGASRHFDKAVIGAAIAAFVIFIFAMMSGLAELPGYEIFSRDLVRW